MDERDGPGRLSHVDAAWLRMDGATNPMVITAALIFDGAVPFAEIEALVEQRFLPHARFRQKVVDTRLPLASPRWAWDEGFDLRAHLHHTRLPAPGGEDELMAFLSEVMSTRLDPTRPLWQAWVVDDALNGTALVVRIHHCLGDGVALMRLLVSMCDDETRSQPPRVGLKAPKPVLNAAELARRSASYASTVGRLLLLPADPPTPFQGVLGSRKLAARAKPVPLAPLKAAAKRADAKLNDLLTSLIAGAVRAYLEARGELPDRRELRAIMPVFLQGDASAGSRNHFGLVFVELPLHEADPHERLRTVKGRMDQLKAQDDATIAFAILDAMGIASRDLEHLYLEVFTRKASLLISSVPGPCEPAALGGHRLRDLVVWSPVSGYLGLGFTVIGYAGQLHLAVYSDGQRVPDPAELALAFEAQVAELAP